MSKNVYLDHNTVKHIDWTSIEYSPGVNPNHYVRVTLYDGLTIFISALVADEISFEYKQMRKDMEKLL